MLPATPNERANLEPYLYPIVNGCDPRLEKKNFPRAKLLVFICFSHPVLVGSNNGTQQLSIHRFSDGTEVVVALAPVLVYQAHSMGLTTFSTGT